MRRYLVLGDETARHPFRQSLPPQVRKEALVATSPQSWREALTITRDDVRGFATSYIACLVAVIAFLI